MVQCPVCRITYVANTIFCAECGLYLPVGERPGTDPLETSEVPWMYEADEAHLEDSDVPKTGPLTIRLRISCPAASSRRRAKPRELEITLLKPIRLGRMDPFHDTYPEVDLTDELAIEQGVSREHACIFRRGNTILVEDLGSTNGTLLNGERLAPYLPVPLKQGDQLQLGKLPIEVLLEAPPSRKTGVKPKVSAGLPPSPSWPGQGAGKTRKV